MLELAARLTKCARRTRHENVLSKVDAEVIGPVGAAELACTPMAAAPSAAASRPTIQMPWRRRMPRQVIAVRGAFPSPRALSGSVRVGRAWRLGRRAA